MYSLSFYFYFYFIFKVSADRLDWTVILINPDIWNHVRRGEGQFVISPLQLVLEILSRIEPRGARKLKHPWDLKKKAYIPRKEFEYTLKNTIRGIELYQLTGR